MAAILFKIEAANRNGYTVLLLLQAPVDGMKCSQQR